MRRTNPLLALPVLAAGALAGCSSSAGGPELIPNGPGGTAAVLNTTLGIISYQSPESLACGTPPCAVDETFSTSSATLSVNGSGNAPKSFNSSTLTDFRTANAVVFDAATNSLTFNVAQGDIAFQDTFGPVLLRNPADIETLENDTLAILLASTPRAIAAAAGAPTGSFDAYLGNPEAADAFIETLKASSDPDDQAALDALTEAATYIESRDFFQYQGSNGTFYWQAKFDDGGEKNTDYVTLGAWGVAPSATATSDEVYGASVFGKNTPIDDIPNTGSATYDGPLVGWLLRENKVEQMRGGVRVTADFPSNAVTFVVDADMAINGPNGTTTYSDIATLTGGGNIVGNRYAGGIASQDDTSLRGNLVGAFFGPQAVQTGGSLTFGNNEISASGSFIGARPTP
ncbi:MAG: transferrin-binding protein-like solute binding protein [Amphiplicatus sp.]